MGSTVAVLGSGSWGTALAIHLARLGNRVQLWGRSADVVARAAGERRHTAHPGVELPPGLVASTDLAEACSGAQSVVFACPSHAMRSVAVAAKPLLRTAGLVVSTAKGIEEDGHRRMSTVLAETVGDQIDTIVVLSGPSFAREVALGMPTALTAAAAEPTAANAVQALFSGPTLRVYTSNDVVGVEVGGSVKNVIAVAAGVSDGLGFGHNTRAALITRGLAEIGRLAVHLGADRQTIYGLSGLGDLVLTCTGDLSRNRTVGLRLGRGESLGAILASMTEVAEGVRNTHAVCELAASVGVEMPITEQMYSVLYEDKEPRQAVVELMTRRPKQEAD